MPLRRVVADALRLDTSRIVLAHTHPEGTAEPSRADREWTRGVARALLLLDIQVHDHIVASGQVHMRFRDIGAI